MSHSSSVHQLWPRCKLSADSSLHLRMLLWLHRFIQFQLHVSISMSQNYLKFTGVKTKQRIYLQNKPSTIASHAICYNPRCYHWQFALTLSLSHIQYATKSYYFHTLSIVHSILPISAATIPASYHCLMLGLLSWSPDFLSSLNLTPFSPDSEIYTLQ